MLLVKTLVHCINLEMKTCSNKQLIRYMHCSTIFTHLCSICKIIYLVLISCVQQAMLDLDLESPEAGIRGSATSKRVTAIPEARITRKRARELSEPAEVCHVPATDPQDGATDQELTVANAHTQSDNHNMTHQGKLFYLLSP